MRLALIMSDQLKLVAILTQVGVASLSKCVDKSAQNSLAELGLGLDATVLAQYLSIEQGVDVFKNKALRTDVLFTLSKEKIRSYLDCEDDELEKKIESFTSFNWKNNQNSKDFLSLFGLDSSVLDEVGSEEEELAVVKPSHGLYGYQNWVRIRLLGILATTANAKVIVHMPTGSGKTRTALQSVIDYIQGNGIFDATIVWLAHSEELCQQAIETMASMWEKYGQSELELIRMWGGRPVPTDIQPGLRFAVLSFPTAYSLITSKHNQHFEFFTQLRRTVEIIVVDEAHQSTAPTYRAAIEHFSNRNSKLVGLTATPGRHHIDQSPEATEELAQFYENNKVEILSDEGAKLEDPIRYLTEKGVLSDVKRFQLHTHIDFELSEREISQINSLLEIPASVLARIGSNAKRTNLVVANIIRLIDDGHKVLVFAPSKDNAIEMAVMMKIKGYAVSSVVGETDPVQRAADIGDFKEGNLDALVNFGVLTTGFDAPIVDAVVVARPTKSVVLYSQMIGRGLRGEGVGGTKECVVVDVIDNIKNMPDMSSAYSYFDSFYGGD